MGRVNVRRLLGSVAVAGMIGTGAASPSLFAQMTAPQRLWNAKSLSCAFSVVSTGNWKDGQSSLAVTPAKLSLTFEEIDADGGVARVAAPTGRFEIVAKLSNGTLHFIQSLDEGPVYLTSIFPKETSGGKLQAVHTRHEYTEVQLSGFTSRPEQYVGECTPTP